MEDCTETIQTIGCQWVAKIQKSVKFGQISKGEFQTMGKGTRDDTKYIDFLYRFMHLPNQKTAQ